nr:hypothetical protein [Tanacetum cinerariifolium]
MELHDDLGYPVSTVEAAADYVDTVDTTSSRFMMKLEKSIGVSRNSLNEENHKVNQKAGSKNQECDQSPPFLCPLVKLNQDPPFVLSFLAANRAYKDCQGVNVVGEG